VRGDARKGIGSISTERQTGEQAAPRDSNCTLYNESTVFPVVSLLSTYIQLIQDPDGGVAKPARRKQTIAFHKQDDFVLLDQFFNPSTGGGIVLRLSVFVQEAIGNGMEGGKGVGREGEGGEGAGSRGWGGGGGEEESVRDGGGGGKG